MLDENPKHIIGITGGIGSGKSLISSLFSSLRIPVYNSDIEAKKLYYEAEIRDKVQSIFGTEIYKSDELDRALLASIVFSDKQKLEKLNSIIHPAVRAHFSNWCAAQSSDILMKEAAILIESGAYKSCSKIIVVHAEKDLRLKRVVERDNSKPSDVLARMDKQLSDEERLKFADWVIDNNGKTSVIKQVFEIVKSIEDSTLID